MIKLCIVIILCLAVRLYMKLLRWIANKCGNSCYDCQYDTRPLGCNEYEPLCPKRGENNDTRFKTR